MELFVDSDDIRVSYRQWLTEDERRGSVVIAHGASEHSGRYERFAQALIAAGFDVYAPDHRGHGETGAGHGAGQLGPRGYDGIVDDVQNLVVLAPDPVVLFGHSMGSVIALRLAESFGDSLAGLALSGALGAMAGVDEAIAGVQQALDGGLGDQPVDALGPFNEPFEPARTPYDWLSRDEAEVDKYIADSFSGDDNPLTYSYLHATLAATRDGAANVAQLPKNLSVLLIAGERDPVSNGAEAVRALAGLIRDAGLTVTEKYYPDARHEVLNETNRDEVTADVVAWLDGVVPR